MNVRIYVRTYINDVNAVALTVEASTLSPKAAFPEEGAHPESVNTKINCHPVTEGRPALRMFSSNARLPEWRLKSSRTLPPSSLKGVKTGASDLMGVSQIDK